MSCNNGIGNSGIVASECSIGKITYNYDEKTQKHIIKTEGGTSIICKTQSPKNNAKIYLITTDNEELIHIENIAGADIIGSSSVWSHLSLSGCNGCKIDMSKNRKKDEINLFYSDKFKSQIIL